MEYNLESFLATVQRMEWRLLYSQENMDAMVNVIDQDLRVKGVLASVD
jgi:hypothetical protein